VFNPDDELAGAERRRNPHENEGTLAELN